MAVAPDLRDSPQAATSLVGIARRDQRDVWGWPGGTGRCGLLRAGSVGAGRSGIDAHVGWGVKAPAVDPARLPATHRMGEKLARPAGKARTRNASGSRRRRTGGSRCSGRFILPGEGARRVGPRVLGVERQADAVATRQVPANALAPGRECPSYETRISSVPAFRSGHPRAGRARCPHSGQNPASPAAARQSPSIKTSTAHAPSVRSAGGPPGCGRSGRARSGSRIAVRSPMRQSRGRGGSPGHGHCYALTPQSAYSLSRQYRLSRRSASFHRAEQQLGASASLRSPWRGPAAWPRRPVARAPSRKEPGGRYPPPAGRRRCPRARDW